MRNNRDVDDTMYLNLFFRDIDPFYIPEFGRKILDISSLDQLHYNGPLKLLPNYDVQDDTRLRVVLIKPLMIPHISVPRSRNMVTVQIPYSYPKKSGNAYQILKDLEIKGLFFKELVCNDLEIRYATQD